MSNFVADVATNVFPVSNIIVKGVVVCMVANRFAANLQLKIDLVAPVSNIAGIMNPRVWIGKYNRPCCILTLLNCGSSSFPAYFISAAYISFPTPSQSLYLYYLASPSYYWVVASSKVFICCSEAYMV